MRRLWALQDHALSVALTKDAHFGDSMERVLYNTILGAWPIQADGTSFLLRGLRNTGKKGWHRDKWPCCSGTFPQLAADYHISTYLRASDGVYVNLFTPSTVNWTDGGGKYGLTQQTKYPLDNKVQINVSGIACSGLCDLCANSRLGNFGSCSLGEWQSRFRAGETGDFRRHQAHVEGWGPRRA